MYSQRCFVILIVEISQRLNITVPRWDGADGSSWWTLGIPHLINLFVAILQGAVDLVGFFIGALTQFLATLAALGPAGMAAGRNVLRYSFHDFYLHINEY